MMQNHYKMNWKSTQLLNNHKEMDFFKSKKGLDSMGDFMWYSINLEKIWKR
jgi:hypothetical protein